MTASGAAPAVAPAEPDDLDEPGEGPLDPRWVRWLTVAVVAGACIAIFWWQRPELLLRNTTASGGDTGAHVWGPAFLRDHVYPHWRLTGWSFDWYAGFPAGQFYFPVPALLVVLADIVLPYNIAFKLVTAAGPVALPAAAYVFGRGLGARRPTPALFAVMTMPFLAFSGDPGDTSIAFNQRIMGGVLASNLAGEYSFTIALAFGLCFLGTFAWTLEHRRRAWLPAMLLAATVGSHVIVALFVVAGAAVLVCSRCLRDPWSKAALAAGTAAAFASGSVFVGALALVVAIVFAAVRAGRGLGRLALPLAIGIVGGLLTAVWTFPMISRFTYTTNMRYEKLTRYLDYLVPGYFWWVFALAGVAVCTAIAVLRRSTLELVVLTALAGATFWRWPELHAWNLRFLPFWYLGFFLLAGAGIAELTRAPAALYREWRRMRAEPLGGDEPTDADQGVAVPSPADEAVGAVAAPEESPPSRDLRVIAPVLATVVALLVGTLATISFRDDVLPYWVRWNYEGYEAKPAFPEYRAVIDTMAGLPAGRVLWEKATENGGDTLNYYGTDFALMMLPYWTDGRISSMEGLYYESSASTPYHFLTTAHVARNPSGAVRGLPYVSPALTDFHHGVRQMQAFGVRYYMAQTPEAQRLADADPDLELVATVPDQDGLAPQGWKIYEVSGAGEVAPLAYEPVVVADVDRGDGWLDVAARWWEEPAQLDRPFAAGGPNDWARVEADELADAPFRSLPDVEVTRVRHTDDSISFRVSRTGVPVTVRSSYYPNWVAHGADGPWRLSPNLMVVVPTEREVTLTFERSGMEWLGIVAGLLGVAGLVCLILWRPRRREDAA